MAALDQSGQARADWDQRVGRRRGPGLDSGAAARLPAPAGLGAVPGRGHVMLDWEPVPGAAGYLVYRAAGAGGPFEPLDHGVGNVLPVPPGPYADTTGQAGRLRYYAVAAVADGESAGPRSGAVAAAPFPGSGPGAVEVEVGDAVTGELAR